MLNMSNPPEASSPRASGSSSPESSYHTKRVRNNLAVKKCREAKRKQEKEMLAAVNKQKELNKKLEEEYEKAKMEEQMLRAMLPFCTAGQQYCKQSKSSSNNHGQEPNSINKSNLSLASSSFLSSQQHLSGSSFSKDKLPKPPTNKKFHQNPKK